MYLSFVWECLAILLVRMCISGTYIYHIQNRYLLVGLRHNQLQRLQKLQNYTARMLTSSGMREPMRPIHKNLHWLPVRQRITFKILKFAHRSIIYGGGPLYLQLDISVTARQTRPTGAPTLVQPLSNLKMAEQVAEPSQWLHPNSGTVSLYSQVLLTKSLCSKAGLKHSCSNNAFKLL